MSNRVALFSADWHAMKHAWTGRKTLSGDAEYGLWQISRLAKRYGIPIIAAGDQFNSMNPDRGMMIRAAEFLAETNGCYVQGNHDKVYPSWMKLVVRHWTHLDEQGADLGAGNVSPVEPDPFVSVPELGPLFESDKPWHVYGADYLLSAELLRERLDRLDRTIEPDPRFANLLVLHQSAPPYAPSFACELLDGMIPDRVDLLVVGHVHEPGTATIRNRSGRPIPTISPGGLHLLDITENPHKKAYILYADGSVRSVALQSRRRREIDLCGMDDREIRETIESVRAAISEQKPRSKVIDVPILYAVCDDSTSPEVAALLKTELGETAHVFVREKGEPERKADGLETGRPDDIDLRRHSEEGFQYAQEVIRRHEPDRDVQAIIDTILVSEVDASLYATLKTDFKEQQHVKDPSGPVGELLPA